MKAGLVTAAHSPPQDGGERREERPERGEEPSARDEADAVRAGEGEEGEYEREKGACEDDDMRLGGWFHNNLPCRESMLGRHRELSPAPALRPRATLHRLCAAHRGSNRRCRRCSSNPGRRKRPSDAPPCAAALSAAGKPGYDACNPHTEKSCSQAPAARLARAIRALTCTAIRKRREKTRDGETKANGASEGDDQDRTPEGAVRLDGAS